MPELPIRRLIIYKHGVGYFERRGAVSGTALRLSFPREAMDDVLKSLVMLDLGEGQVHGVDFETPEDRAQQIARGSIHLSDDRSLLDLLRDLRGRQVRLWLEEEREEPRKNFGLRGGRPSEPRELADAGGPPVPEMPPPSRTQIDGLVIGIDIEDHENLLRAPIVSIYQPEQRRVRTYGLREIKRLELADDRSAEDLTYFLRAAQSEEDRRAATLRLSDGEHDLLVGYIAPAPAWRVSYRILFEPEGSRQAAEGSQQSSANGSLLPSASCLLQGWGLFDNQLDEDLQDVTLTLVAGMPVSFRYRLYEPHTPERPLIADEERTVTAPIEFAGAMPPPPPPAAPMMMAAAAPADMAKRSRTMGFSADEPTTERLSLDILETSTAAASAGEERGALFQYRVTHPVSVARGQSAMVPIVGQRLDGRKELLYNGQKLPKHPVASLRMRNETGLTLERGPVTVIEQGDYAGEAVLPFTRAGGELIVPYAVELGITIQEQHSGERQTRGISVRDDYLLFQEWDVRHTRYAIHSTLPAAAEVMIEQALLQGYELTETSTPAEQAQGLARWPVTCLPGVETTFDVHQRQETSRWERVRGVTSKQLRDFLKRRYLDDATYAALSGVLELYAQIEAHNRRLQEIERDRTAIYRQQQQIQGSLSPLGREGEEGTLRSRYVAALGEMEDRLAALGAEEQRVQAENTRLEQQAAARLAELAGK
ncbi:MAG TPA: hypothetical protein VFU22_02015 [Roseiflexaceae bacterium]|nr:hypothetical protein [Roseiflexaceae bacterium]